MVIKKGSSQANYPKYFFVNNTEKYNMNEVVNSFNEFFVNIGPSLAEKIPDPAVSDVQNDNLIDRNLSSMFLTAVDEK